MNTIRIGTLVLFMLNIYFNYAEPTGESAITQSNPDKRDHYYSENVGSYYSNFNQPDNAITTVLPLLDSDGTLKLVNDAPDEDDGDGEDDALVSHSIDDGVQYFRGYKHIKPFFNPITDDKPNLDWYNDNAIDNRMDIRGKKFISFYPLRLYPKRAPSGFLGLRGKKYYYNGAKRVPSGFTGMRGKKSYHDENNNIDDNASEYAIINDVNFAALSQKERKFLDELYEIYQTNQDMQHNRLISDDNALLYSSKRAPSGFLGMRGKKDADSKRAPSGFLGLRGKRESADDYIRGNKRSPFISYIGLRGNNAPMVSDHASGEFFSELDKMDWPMNERLEINRSPPKRVPNGFLGVRGKKWADAVYDK